MTTEARLGLQGAPLFSELKRRNVVKAASAIDPGNPCYGVGLAFVYACAGRDNDQAFACMDRAFAESPAGLYYIAADPGADAMRSDPRWQELLDRLTQAQR